MLSRLGASARKGAVTCGCATLLVLQKSPFGDVVMFALFCPIVLLYVPHIWHCTRTWISALLRGRGPEFRRLGE